jgi:hypothetical protein
MKPRQKWRGFIIELNVLTFRSVLYTGCMDVFRHGVRIDLEKLKRPPNNN